MRTPKLAVSSVIVYAASLLPAAVLAVSAAAPAGAAWTEVAGAMAFPTFSGRLSGVAAPSASSA